MSEDKKLEHSLNKYFETIDPVIFFNDYLGRLINVLKSNQTFQFTEENGSHIEALNFEANEESREFINFLLKSLHAFNKTTEEDSTKLLEYANSITGWITHKKKDIPSRIIEIVENKDVLYQNYLARAKYLTNEYPEEAYNSILLIPDLFLLFCFILESDEIDDDYKLEVSLALVYLVSPIDLLPENFINHPLSLLDDLFLMLGAFNRNEAKKVLAGNLSLNPDIIERTEDTILKIEKEFGKNSIITIHEAVISVKEKSKN